MAISCLVMTWSALSLTMYSGVGERAGSGGAVGEEGAGGGRAGDGAGGGGEGAGCRQPLLGLLFHPHLGSAMFCNKINEYKI